MFLFLMQLALATTTTCTQPTISCQCGPAVPFEGYQIFLVEKCGEQENWMTSYGERHYTTQADCEQAIQTDLDCQRVSN